MPGPTDGNWQCSSLIISMCQISSSNVQFIVSKDHGSLPSAAQKKSGNEWIIMLLIEFIQAFCLWICKQGTETLVTSNVVISITIMCLRCCFRGRHLTQHLSCTAGLCHLPIVST